jgi:hypothetical protein
MLRKLISVSCFLLFNTIVFSQKDSIILVNNQVLIGEIISMEHSILVFETSYSDSDFKIKWGKVNEIYSKRNFILILSDLTRFKSTINTDFNNKENVILNNNGKTVTTTLNNVTSLDPFTKETFSKQIDLAFATGFSLTKENNFKQLSLNSKIEYKDFKWNFLNSFNLVYSSQDNTDGISRYEMNLNVHRFSKKDWYLSSGIDLLSNSAQQLRLRTTSSLGIGYFFKKNNRLYFGIGSGLAYNIERYKNTDDSRNSLESYFAAELNKYDIGDFSILTSAILSPSLTEKGRVRFDCKFNLKYDITSRFYLNANLTYNLDNQSVTGSPKGNYVFQTTIGWDND